MSISYIDITSLPNKLTYNAGESIDITGLVVHGYDENGNDQGVINNSLLSISCEGGTHTGMTATSNSVVSTGGAVISSWSGNRSPIKKRNDGDCFVFIGKNCAYDPLYGSNWVLFIGISDTEEKAALDMSGDGGKGAGKRTINGIDYWLHLSGSNAGWGGATPSTVTNPFNLLVIENDQSLHSTNTIPTDEQVKKYIRALGVKYVGGAVTISYNGMFTQYGISGSPNPINAGGGWNYAYR